MKRSLFALLAIVCLLSCMSNYEPGKDYVSRLREYSVYDWTATSNLPYPVWQNRDDPYLVALNKTFALTEQCQGKTDWDKAQALAIWMKANLKHNGNSGMPKYRDALNLLSTYFADQTITGYNCRLLALIYQDCALSLGLKVRVVFLLPESLSNDSHVVCEIFSKELDQWIFVDPSYCAWFSSGDRFLSAFDLRQKIAAFQSDFQVNAQAGYNRGPFDLDYIHYLSKNLFYLGFFAEHKSGYDSGPKTEMYLCPTRTSGPSLFGRKVYMTTNPNYFYPL